MKEVVRLTTNIIRRNKKLFIIILAVVMLISIIQENDIVVKADDYSGVVTLTSDKSEIHVGDVFTVDVSVAVTGFEGISIFNAVLDYDSSVFEWIGVEFDSNWIDFSNLNNKILFIQSNKNNIGTICKIKFKSLKENPSINIRLFEIEAGGIDGGQIHWKDSNVNLPIINLNIISKNYGDELQLIADKLVCKPGDEIFVSIEIKHLNTLQGITSFMIWHNYDDNVFECIEIIEPTGFSRITASLENRKSIWLQRESLSIPPIMTGNICIVKYKVLENAKIGKTVIGFENIELGNLSNGKEIYSEEGEVNEPAIILTIQNSDSKPSGGSLDYNIDYENHQLIVANGSNNLLFLGAEDKKGVVKSYELFEASSNTTKIDLSKFSAKKEWKLKLYGDVDTTPVTIPLAARASKVKAVYSPIGTTVANRITFTDNGTPVALNKLEYRTTYSKWNDASTLTMEQLDGYSVYGATLIFRIKAVEDNNPYSAEAKMKIAKKANAPKITIDYSKLTIKMTDKIEYRTSHSGIWTTAIKGAVPIKSITNIETNTLYLEARTAATNGKMASKIAVITLDVQDNAPVIGTNLKVTNNTTEGKTISITLKNESTEKIIEYALVNKDIQVSSLDLTKQKWKKLNRRRPERQSGHT